MTTYALTMTFIFGTIFGSFFNVVIYRLPKHESIVYGSSHCANCMTTIKPYDLIPIVSFILLGGKCRTCHQRISYRYPFIEFLTGLTYLIVVMKYGFTLTSIIGLILTSILIIVTMIDIDTMDIYDRFIIMIFILAFVNLFISPLSILDHLLGAFIISIPFLIIAYITQGIGGGDIKLIAATGLLLGWQSTLLAFFIASIAGGTFGFYLLKFKDKTGKSMLPFGPFLCLGIYIAFNFGQPLINWYINLFI